MLFFLEKSANIPKIPVYQKFQKGVGGQRGLARRNPSRPEIQASFLYPFSYARLGKWGHDFWRTFGLLWGFLCHQPPPANPFSKPPSLVNEFFGDSTGATKLDRPHCKEFWEVRGRKSGSLSSREHSDPWMLSGPVRDTPPISLAIPFRDSIAEGGIAPICLVFKGYWRQYRWDTPFEGGGVSQHLHFACSQSGKRSEKGEGYRTQLAMLRHQKNPIARNRGGIAEIVSRYRAIRGPLRPGCLCPSASPEERSGVRPRGPKRDPRRPCA